MTALISNIRPNRLTEMAELGGVLRCSLLLQAAGVEFPFSMLYSHAFIGSPLLPSYPCWTNLLFLPDWHDQNPLPPSSRHFGLRRVFSICTRYHDPTEEIRGHLTSYCRLSLSRHPDQIGPGRAGPTPDRLPPPICMRMAKQGEAVKNGVRWRHFTAQWIAPSLAAWRCSHPRRDHPQRQGPRSCCAIHAAVTSALFLSYSCFLSEEKIAPDFFSCLVKYL